MDQTTENVLKQILNMSDPALFALFMTLVGKIISLDSFPVHSKHITWILPVVNAPLYCWMMGFTGRHVVEGLLIGSAAIGLNQFWRQMVVKPEPDQPVKPDEPAKPQPPTTVVSLLLAGMLAIGAFAGCKATLEPGGAYAPVGQKADMTFYAIDAAFNLAYAAVDGAFKFERDNRKALWAISPKIKRDLDYIRPDAAKVVVRYMAARKAYLANPVPDNLTELQNVLALAQRISAAAVAAVPKGK